MIRLPGGMGRRSLAPDKQRSGITCSAGGTDQDITRDKGYQGY